LRALTPAVVREWYASALRSRGGRTSISSTSIRRVAGIRRDDIEDYEVWPSGSPGVKGALSANTHRQLLRTLRASLERLIEWDWPDAPPATRSWAATSPKNPSRCRTSHDDRDTARFQFLLGGDEGPPPGTSDT
jgi:hypothetical protein